MTVADFRKELRKRGFSENQIETAIFMCWTVASSISDLEARCKVKFDEMISRV